MRARWAKRAVAHPAVWLLVSLGTAQAATTPAGLSAGPAIGSRPRGAPPPVPLTANGPVTFQADSVSYDRDHGLVSATGHVEAWQNDHILKADRVTFDRNTNVAAAYGHVVIVEPDGEVLFADYAELTQGMKDGVLTACGRCCRPTGGWRATAASGSRASSTN